MPAPDLPVERPGLKKRPQQMRSRITVEAVLEAAFQVLTAEGFDGLTTTAVAERAGVSVGTLYQYVPDKAALVGAVVEAYLAREEDALRAALVAGADLPLGDLLERLVDAFFGIHAEATDRSAAILTGAERVGWTAGIDALTDRVVALLAPAFAARAAEIARPDPARAAFVTVHAVDGFIRRAVVERADDVASGVAAEEAKALVRGYLLG